MKGYILIPIFFLFLQNVFSQQYMLSQNEIDSLHITFKDTVFNIVFDSVENNLGYIKPAKGSNKLVKYFKYIGDEPIVITKAWTSDPHYICRYPREPLTPGGIYSFTVCFAHWHKQGKMYKTMGFKLSNGNNIRLRFTGTYLPFEPELKE
jgi:hypothetical protein